MKKAFKYLLAASLAAFAFASCEEIPEVNPVFTLSGDQTFTDMKATVKVTADVAAPADIEVTIALDDASTIKDVEFPATLTVKQGEKEATATVNLKSIANLTPGVESKAIFSASVNGEKLTQTVTITFTRPDLAGAWGIVGLGGNWDNDIVMTAGQDGWYKAENVEAEAGDKFKFRRDGAWAVNFGGVFAPGEFDVTQDGPDIEIGADGIYTFSLNPNAAKAKVERTGDIVVNYEFTATEFNEELKATLTVKADRAAKEELTVVIALAEGTTFPQGSLTFDNITIAQGETEGTTEVAIGRVDYGEYAAIFTATLGETALGTVTLNYTKAVPKMTIKDLKNLGAPGVKDKEFIGDFSDIYVTYVIGTNHAYLEDATGAIYYWASKLPDAVKVGMKINGVISGLVSDKQGYPMVNWADFSRLTAESVTVATAEEMPKPVKGTFASFKENFSDLVFRLVEVEDAVLENAAKWGENTVSDATDTFIAFLNFTPPSLPKGTKVSGKGLFTINWDNNHQIIKVFSANDITKTELPEKKVKVEKLWSKISTADANWMAGFGGKAGSDFNIAIDDTNVYVAEFGGTKKIWAINIARSTSDNLSATPLDDQYIKSEGFDGSIFTSCARVIKKNDGTPVLLVSNLSTGAYGWLYAYENGIDKAPVAYKLDQYSAGRRLGDTFSVYGTYEKAMLIFASHGEGTNGFVTFQLPGNANNVCGLWNRYGITLNAAFEGYWPFPGDLTHGMFGKRIAGGDGYRSQFMTIDATEQQLWDTSSAAFTATTTGLDWLANAQNFSGVAYNYITFNGKRYVIWGSNTNYSGAKATLMIKEASTDTDWKTILNTDGLFYSDVLEGTVATGWKGGLDVAAFETNDAVYIAINKANTGIAVYKMYLGY